MSDMKTTHAMTGSLAVVLTMSWTLLLHAQQGNLREDVHFHGDITYAEVGQKTLKLDLYVPRDIRGSLPCVVWIHGGAWRAGNKKNPRVAWLTEHGYVVASLQYRLSQEGVFPAQIHDCKGAIRWLRAHAAAYAIDPRCIGVAGSSAGGHLAALLGTSGDVAALEGQTGGHLDHSSRVQAVLDMFGPTDFTRMNEHAYPGSILDHDAADSPESLLLGGAVQENPDKAARANPITYVSQDDPPFLILHGDRDKLVPHHQNELLEAALQEAGVPVTLHTIQGAGHGWPRTGERDARVLAFFDRCLKRVAEPPTERPSSGAAGPG
jgi:acetyl esterase/lipase